jgi:uncharacterized membrane protein (DUF2068 family)
MLNDKVSKKLIIISVLAIFQAVLRLYFSLATAGVFGPQLQNDVQNMVDVAMTDADWTFMALMFGLIGLIGLVSAFGLLLSAKWGFYGMIAISAVTIVYDVWAMVAIQFTAAMGLVLPVVFIVYLVMRKERLLTAGMTC